jgi:hypothetical protein
VRPEGVADGYPVEIPDPGQGQWEDAFRRSIPHRWLLRARLRLVLLKDWSKGRSRGRAPFGANELDWTGAEKIPSALIIFATVLQTDTGSRVEKTKAFERTLVKELGKWAP